MFFKKLNLILENKFNSKFLFVTLITTFGALLETIGLASFIPVLTSLLDQDNLDKYNFLNFPINEFIKYSLLVLLIIFIFKNFFLIFTKYTQLNFARQIQIYISNKLIKFYLYRDYEEHLNQSSSEITRNIIFETTKIQGLVNHMTEFLTEVLILIGIISLALYFNTEFTLYIFFLFSFIFFGIFFSVKNKVKKLGEEDIVVNEKRIGSMNQIIKGIIELKVFNKEEESSKLYIESNKRLNSIHLLITIFKIVPKFLIEIFVILIVVLYFLFGFENMQNIDNMILNLSFYGIIVYRLLPSLNRILATSQSIKSLSPALDVVKKEIEKSNEYKKRAKLNYIEDFKKEIKLKKLCFNYDERIIFKDQNLSIKKNNLILLSGKNGSGKTTIINILLGLIRPKDLKIYIDDESKTFRNFTENKFKVSYVPAKPFLINDTIKNNITFFDENNNKFQNLLQNEWINEFLKKFDDGYDHFVTENGKNISEGEKQNIALARALYFDPTILILDEPTSNLDIKARELFFEMIYKLKKKYTIILISHEDKHKISYDYNLHIDDGIIKEI